MATSCLWTKKKIMDSVFGQTECEEEVLDEM